MSEPLAPDEKVCPFCAETIKKAAVKCRFCQSDLPTEEVQESAPPVPAPVADEPPAPDEAPTTTAAPGTQPLLASLRLTVGLLVLCLVLAAVVGGTYWWGQRDDDSVVGAISSAKARQAGLEQAGPLTQRVLSYDWRSLDDDVKKAEAVMAPSFRSEYAKTIAGVRDQTIKNQVQLAATAAAVAVVSATPDQVVTLVFVNQVTQAKGTNNRRLDQNRVLVTLTRHGGEWRVSKMDPF